MSTIPTDIVAEPGEKVLYLTVAVAFSAAGESLCRAGRVGLEVGELVSDALLIAIREAIADPSGVIDGSFGRLIGKATLVVDPTVNPHTANEGDPR